MFKSTKFTVKGFYDFCANESPTKPINNKFWSTCALGLYMKSIGEPFLEKKQGFFVCHLNLPRELESRLCDGLFCEFGEIVSFIDRNKLIEEDLERRNFLNTFTLGRK